MPLLPTAAPVDGDQRFDMSARPEAALARHTDDAAIAAVTNLYREVFPAGGDPLYAVIGRSLGPAPPVGDD